MKNKLLLLALVISLTGCSLLPKRPSSLSEEEDTSISSTDDSQAHPSSHDLSDDISEDASSEGEDISPVDSIQDMNILHAWNWRLNDVKSRLQTIKNAGYGAIQLSPMQPKVDKTNYSGESTKSQWWKLYQPLAFKVAGSGESILGTKSDLTSLCAEAKKYDLKIVMDIVSNHLAGDGDGYNSQVYKQYPLHHFGSTNDNSVQAVVQGHIGLPDLDTSNSQVQQDVLSMMKEYIDCGVSGFRFDAAKHIETPDDGSYASNYWPYVLNGTTSYAQSKNMGEPYYYGEILNTCGSGRSFSSYTSMMSVVDNKQGTAMVKAVNDKSFSSLKKTYDTGVNPDHLVLWAESHDTYANDSGYEVTRGYTTETINKTYIMQASRKDAATLYFARPSSREVTICSIDDNSGWKNKEVVAANNFHRRYIDKSENVVSNNNCFVNIRGEGSFAGAAIVNINANSTQSVNVNGLANGTYTDLISNKDFTVNNEKVTVSFTNGACLLVPKDGSSEQTSETSETVSCQSSVVLKGYNSSLSYFAWTWSDSKSGSWMAFTNDNDALGINLDNNDNYIIVEFPNGTTSSTVNWDSKIRQTVDLKYYGSQIIHKLPWK